MADLQLTVIPTTITEGGLITLRAAPPTAADTFKYAWTASGGKIVAPGDATTAWEVQLDTTDLRPGSYRVSCTATKLDSKGNQTNETYSGTSDVVVEPRPISKDDLLPVILRRTEADPTEDQPLWVAIRNRAEATSFNSYQAFIERLFSNDTATAQGELDERGKLETRLPGYFQRDAGDSRYPAYLYGVDAFELLRDATKVFLVLENGLSIHAPKLTTTGQYDTTGGSLDDETTRLGRSTSLSEMQNMLSSYLGSNKLTPYIDRILDRLDADIVSGDAPALPRIFNPSNADIPYLLELIWNYWHEEGMLVQTMNAISLRFQNRRSGPAGRDPLAHLAVDPLRPLNNLIWGYVQNENQRLTVTRRAYEYDHQYGFTLWGKAVPPLHSADSRSKFLEAFHDLLLRCAIFYQEDSDTTVVSDGFPLLNALKELHMVLAQGAHNQFGDLTWTARVEFLIMQWILARPEMREFLGGRAMVPYAEGWMDRVDTMKKVQGWTDTPITTFRDLGVYGEQILLSVRYGDWSTVNDQAQAKNWARYWRPEVQSYIHAYRVATGVDLTNADSPDATMPSVHLRQRLSMRTSAGGGALARARANRGV